MLRPPVEIDPGQRQAIAALPPEEQPEGQKKPAAREELKLGGTVSADFIVSGTSEAPAVSAFVHAAPLEVETHFDKRHSRHVINPSGCVFFRHGVAQSPHRIVEIW